ADRYSSVPVLHKTILHDDVLSGCLETPPVCVASGLDSNTVVAGVEGTVFDQHVTARFRIATVIIWTMTIDVHVLDDYVATEHRMNFPHRRVVDCHAFDQNVLAAIWLNKLRPQIMSLAEHAFPHRHTLFRHRHQCIAIGTLLAHALFPAVL